MKTLLKPCLACLIGASFLCTFSLFADGGGAAGGGGVTMGLPASPVAMPGEMDPGQALVICQSFDQAFASGSVALLSNLIADGAMHVNPLGMVLSKAEFLDNIQAGKVRFSEYKTLTLDFVEQVGMTLMLGGLLEASAVRDGQTIAGQFRFIRIMVPSADMRWQEIYSQMTQVQPMAANAATVQAPATAGVMGAATSTNNAKPTATAGNASSTTTPTSVPAAQKAPTQ